MVIAVSASSKESRSSAGLKGGDGPRLQDIKIPNHITAGNREKYFVRKEARIILTINFMHF